MQLLENMIISPFSRLTRTDYMVIATKMDEVDETSYLRPCDEAYGLEGAQPGVCMRSGTRTECNSYYEVVPAEGKSGSNSTSSASVVRPCVWTGVRCRAHAFSTHACVILQGTNATRSAAPNDDYHADNVDDFEIREVSEEEEEVVWHNIYLHGYEGTDAGTWTHTSDASKQNAPIEDEDSGLETETELEELDEEVISPRERHVRAMVHLTRFVCEHQEALPKEAFQARIRAGTVWAHLDDAQANRSCYDCITRKLGSCDLWFRTPRGTYEHQEQANSEIKRAQIELFEQAVGEHMDKACCARSRTQPWMPLQCDRKYCVMHAQRRGMQRIAHTLRTIATNSKHPVAKDMTVSDLMAADMLAPQQHSIKECQRDAFMHGGSRDEIDGPTDEECVLKSILHHTSRRHGVGIDEVHSSLESMGFSLVDMFRRAVSAAGGSAPAATRRQAPAPGMATIDGNNAKMHDGVRGAATEARRRRTADAHRRRTQSEEDRARALLDEGLPPGEVDDSDDEFKFDPFAGMLQSVLPKQDNIPIARRAAEMLASASQWRFRASALVRNLSEASELRSDADTSLNAKHSTLGTFAYVINGDGSAFRQMSGIAQGVAAAFDHVHNLTHTVQSAIGGHHVQERRRRVLEERIERESSPNARMANTAQINIFLNNFLVSPDKSALKEPLRRKMSGQPGPQGAPLNDLPEWYVQRYGKFVARVPWRKYFKRMDEFAKIEKKRMLWWRDRAHEEDELPHELRHGHWALDQRIPPTSIGRAARAFAAYLEGDEAVWETENGGSAAIDRNIKHVLENSPLKEGREPNWWGDPERKGVAASLGGMLDAGGRASSLRRLSEVVSKSVLYAPYGVAYVIPTGITDSLSGIASWGIGTLTSVYRTAQSVLLVDQVANSARVTSDVSIWDAVSRWFLYNVVLCYLYPRPRNPAESIGGTETNPAITNDGRNIRSFHASRMCFPAIPFRPLGMPAFLEFFNFTYAEVEKLNYTSACSADTVKATMGVLDSVGISLRSPEWTPVAFALRPAEAIDALTEYALSVVASKDSGAEAAFHIVCGITFSGGILYMLILIPVLTVIFMCLPCVTSCSLFCSTSIVYIIARLIGGAGGAQRGLRQRIRRVRPRRARVDPCRSTSTAAVALSTDARSRRFQHRFEPVTAHSSSSEEE